MLELLEGSALKPVYDIYKATVAAGEGEAFAIDVDHVADGHIKEDRIIRMLAAELRSTPKIGLKESIKRVSLWFDIHRAVVALFADRAIEFNQLAASGADPSVVFTWPGIVQ
jgi:predicted nucleic acid-binding protein